PLATTGAYVIGTLLILPTTVVTAPFYPAPRLASPIGWAVVLYQGILGAVAPVWGYRAVQVIGPSPRAGVVSGGADRRLAARRDRVCPRRRRPDDAGPARVLVS